MLLEIACTGTEIRNWIEVQRYDIDSDHATRVPGNAKYDGADVLLPALGYQLRTTPTGSGGVAVVVLQHSALAFTAPNRTFIFELIHCRRDELVVQALMVPLGVIVKHVVLDSSAKVSLAEDDHPVQTLGFYGQNKSFGEGIQVGALRW